MIINNIKLIAKLKHYGYLVFSFTYLISMLPLNLMALDEIPIPLEEYNDSQMSSLSDILIHRINFEPFNLVISVVFLLAIIHTFLAGKIHNLAIKVERRRIKKIRELKSLNQIPEDAYEHSITSGLLKFFGEVEVVLMIWVIVLGIIFLVSDKWTVFLYYLENKVVFTEPLFVVVIMTIASTRPITYSTEIIVSWLAKKLKLIFRSFSGSLAFICLFFVSLMGSIITEVAAITIAALLMSDLIFKHTKNMTFKYASLGCLLVNISIGGALTHFAAPVILIVAQKWNITTLYTLENFGLPVILSCFIVSMLYYLIFFKEFKRIDTKIDLENANKPKEKPKLAVPVWIIMIHYGFIVWTVFNSHHPVLFLGGYLILIGFVLATVPYQNSINVRSPLLIGMFLAGLIIHGGLQGWWIVPLLSQLNDVELFGTSFVLSMFNDNAGVSFLSSLIPNISESAKKLILSGALTAGGMTILANAPNPTAFTLLKSDFDKGISHFYVFLAALLPSIIAVIMFLVF